MLFLKRTILSENVEFKLKINLKIHFSTVEQMLTNLIFTIN